MKLILSIFLVSIILNGTFSKKACRTMKTCNEDVWKFFVVPKDFRITIFEQFGTETHQLEEYSRYTNKIEEQFDIDGTKIIQTSEEFKEKTKLVEKVIKTKTIQVDVEGNWAKNSPFASVASIITDLITSGVLQVANGQKKSRCSKKCLEGIDNIYDIHLTITHKLWRQTKGIFKRTKNPTKCKRQQRLYKKLYKQASNKYPNNVKKALYYYAENKIAKPFCI